MASAQSPAAHTGYTVPGRYMYEGGHLPVSVAEHGSASFDVKSITGGDSSNGSECGGGPGG